jgi:hypothetical protein
MVFSKLKERSGIIENSSSDQVRTGDKALFCFSFALVKQKGGSFLRGFPLIRSKNIPKSREGSRVLLVVDGFDFSPPPRNYRDFHAASFWGEHAQGRQTRGTTAWKPGLGSGSSHFNGGNEKFVVTDLPCRLTKLGHVCQLSQKLSCMLTFYDHGILSLAATA